MEHSDSCPELHLHILVQSPLGRESPSSKVISPILHSKTKVCCLKKSSFMSNHFEDIDDHKKLKAYSSKM